MLTLQLNPDATDHSRETLLIALKQLDGGKDWVVIKRNARNTIARHSGLGLFYKDFSRDTSLLGRLKGWAGQDAVARSRRGASLLADCGLLAPALIGTGERDGRPFVLMTELSGPQLHNSLRSFLTHPRGQRLHWKRQLLQRLGHAVGRLHQQRLAHGDLRPNNLILHVHRGQLDIGFIDNDRTRRPWQFERERRRNLTQLMMLNSDDVTRTDRLRFFRAYFEACPLSATAQRQLMRAVSRATAERMHGNPPPTGTLIDESWWSYLNNLSQHEQRDD